jgi:hypothetical protein
MAPTYQELQAQYQVQVAQNRLLSARMDTLTGQVQELVKRIDTLTVTDAKPAAPEPATSLVTMREFFVQRGVVKLNTRVAQTMRHAAERECRKRGVQPVCVGKHGGTGGRLFAYPVEVLQEAYEKNSERLFKAATAKKRQPK